VQAVIRVADGNWTGITLLIDGGVDRTVFSARYLHKLGPLKTTERGEGLTGIGGGASSLAVETAIAFMRDDRQTVTVRGSFAIFTEIESADLSILGRDVTNNFSVIYDFPKRIVSLLAPPHFYEVRKQ
jgi:hypothetical protein